MRTILDENRHKTRTYILYGNVNDLACPADNVLCNMEYYLVKLLKSRGYKHIVFYGGAGNIGIDCRDPESARFFFEEQNKGLELPDMTRALGSEKKKDDTEYEKKEASLSQQEQPAPSQTSSGSMGARPVRKLR